MTNKNASDSSIRTNSTSSTTKRKIRKSQVPFGIGLFVLLVIFGVFLSTISGKLSLFWLTGISFGFILQKSRFCFTASMRDPFLTGGTMITRAVLIALAITSIGFTAIKYGDFARGLAISGQSYVVPISIATAVGAFIFGIGMVIAGGCSSGTLMRVGEGFTLQFLALFFFIIGSLWGAHDFGWWKLNFILKGKTVFLPDILGWFGAILVQLLVIAILYILAEKWETKKQNEEY
ncbi:YeeE/YedE thiosulfate transporter family protein [Clostridium sp.]|uniref:YeeE/YedE thiosulfate transporter family protein n=1 Tax=Clostridium sp. TaxID=1506 RepID=UPI003D6D9293